MIESGPRGGFAPGREDSTVFTPHGAPVVRNSVRLLTVREVSVALSVCRATIYALIDRGELERVWIATSLRVPAESLDAYVARRSGIGNPRRQPLSKPL